MKNSLGKEIRLLGIPSFGSFIISEFYLEGIRSFANSIGRVLRQKRIPSLGISIIWEFYLQGISSFRNSVSWGFYQ